MAEEEKETKKPTKSVSAKDEPAIDIHVVRGQIISAHQKLKHFAENLGATLKNLDAHICHGTVSPEKAQEFANDITAKVEHLSTLEPPTSTTPVKSDADHPGQAPNTPNHPGAAPLIGTVGPGDGVQQPTKTGA